MEERRNRGLSPRRRLRAEPDYAAGGEAGSHPGAEIMKAHGLNHAFEQRPKEPPDIPGEILLHEPWRKNLLWGTDWTYLRIEGRFWFLLVTLDWYSRKLVAWGLFPEITRFEVAAVITSAVASEGIDELPEGAMKPRVFADHGQCAHGASHRHAQAGGDQTAGAVRERGGSPCAYRGRDLGLQLPPPQRRERWLCSELSSCPRKEGTHRKKKRS